MMAAILSPRKDFNMKTLFAIILSLLCPKYVSDAINAATSDEELDELLFGKAD